MKLSIIIPCYNVREYIDECLSSVYRAVRSFNDVEIVVVDDGSTDSTLLALNRWKKRFKNFNLIESENKGVSNARNLGVHHSVGEYLFFVDADDKIHHKNFLIIYDELQVVDADVIFNTFFWWEGYHSWETGFLSLTPKKIIKEKNIVFSSMFNDQQFYLWSKIFKKNVFENLSFPIGKFFEDVSLLPKIYDTCESFYYIPISIVYYRQREGSILNGKREESLLDYIDCYGYLTAGNNYSQKVLRDLECFYAQIYVWCINDCSDSSYICGKRKKSLVKKIKSIYKANSSKSVKDVSIGLFKKARYKFLLKYLLAYNLPFVFLMGRKLKERLKS